MKKQCELILINCPWVRPRPRLNSDEFLLAEESAGGGQGDRRAFRLRRLKKGLEEIMTDWLLMMIIISILLPVSPPAPGWPTLGYSWPEIWSDPKIFMNLQFA